MLSTAAPVAMLSGNDGARKQKALTAKSVEEPETAGLLAQWTFTYVHAHGSSILFKHRIFPKPESTFGSDALALGYIFELDRADTG